MKRWSKKVIVVSVAVLSIVVLVASGFALKPVILEQWYIWKLESEHKESRYDAVKKLAEMGAVGAVPAILKILERPSVVRAEYRSSTGLSPREMLFFYLFKLTSVAGKRSVPYLGTALDDKGWYVPYLSALLLGGRGNTASGVGSSVSGGIDNEASGFWSSVSGGEDNYAIGLISSVSGGLIGIGLYWLSSPIVLPAYFGAPTGGWVYSGSGSLFGL